MSRPIGFHHTEITKGKIGIANFGENNGMWKGDLAKYKETARERTQRRFPLKICERCRTKKGFDRHHIDSNVFNNIKENILILCRSCHMIIDGRMERLHAVSLLQI